MMVLMGGGVVFSSYYDDKWPPAQEQPSSVPTLSYILATCGQFCCKLSISFSGLSPDSKMPSSGNKLKSQLGTEKCNEQKILATQMWAGKRGGRKPRKHEHHVTLCMYLKSRHDTQLLKRPQRSNYTEQNPNKSPFPHSFHAWAKVLLE